MEDLYGRKALLFSRRPRENDQLLDKHRATPPPPPPPQRYMGERQRDMSLDAQRHKRV